MREFGDELTYEALTKMEVLHAIITEALRMHPPLVMLLRYAKESTSVTTKEGKQYVIPKVRVCGGVLWSQGVVVVVLFVNCGSVC